MYAEHALKKANLEAQRQKKLNEEQAKLDQGRKNGRRVSTEQARQTSERLYHNAFAIESRLKEMRLQQDQHEKSIVQQNMLKNKPTLRKIRNLGDAAKAADRLHRDAERRERDRVLRVEDTLLSEQEYFGSFQQHHVRRTTRRHLDLYAEAECRRERADNRREQSEQDYLDKFRQSGSEWLEYNPDRIEELHALHAEKQRKIATLAAEKQMREDAIASEAASQFKRSLNHSGLGDEGGLTPRRPPIVDDPRSPRSVYSTVRRERDAEKQKQLRQERNDRELAKQNRLSTGETTPRRSSRQLANCSDHLVNTVNQTVQHRLGCNSSTEQTVCNDNKSMLNEMAQIMEIVREAQRNCEASDGYSALCNRASERLYNQLLIPDCEGWMRNVAPDRIVQVEGSLDELIVSAEKAQVSLRNLVAGQEWLHGEVKSHPSGCPLALFVYDNGPKTEAAARAKAVVRYGPSEGTRGCFKHLLDLSRLLLVFSTCDLLSSGLDQILRHFEVVDVRNYFARPGRLGVRFVEVLIVVQVNKGTAEEPDMIPHVCELRLEELCFHKAQAAFAPALRNWYTSYHNFYDRPSRDSACLSSLANTVMSRPAVAHDVRVFKCHLAKRYGSTISGWRKEFGGSRLLDFKRFRSLCQKMNYCERAAEFWQALDPTVGGVISLFDFDSEAVSSLIHLRLRLLGLADTGPSSDKPTRVDADAIFSRLSFLTRPGTTGRLEAQEWRKCMMSIGLTSEEGDKLFKHLLLHHEPPQAIGVTDLEWLLNLNSLVDIEAVHMNSATAATQHDALSYITWCSTAARNKSKSEILRWCVFKDNADDQDDRCERDRQGKRGCKAKSEEPLHKLRNGGGSSRAALTKDFSDGAGKFRPDGARTPPTPPLMEQPELADSDDELMDQRSCPLAVFAHSQTKIMSDDEDELGAMTPATTTTAPPEEPDRDANFDAIASSTRTSFCGN
jgi:hypothetical protein